MITLSVDSTCIDLLMLYPPSPLHRKDFTDFLELLFEQDLQITRATFITASVFSPGALRVLAEIRYERFISPVLDDSELSEAILSKSDHQLRGFLHQPKFLSTLNADTVAEALVTSTIIGWIDGCRILLNANVMAYLRNPNLATQDGRQSLLSISTVTNRPDLLSFWLSQREVCDEQQLNLIGHIEDPLSLGWGRSTNPTMDVVQLVSSHIIKQRHEVKLLMENRDIQHCCESSRTSFPDAHMGCILTALVSEGVDVPTRYWPKRKSLYYMTNMWTFNRLKVLETFEEAGFCDISQKHFECSKETACSPLVYLATDYMWDVGPGGLTERDTTVRWFLSRGANLRETWPGTKITAVHCLAWQSAQCLQFAFNRHPPYSHDPPLMQYCWTYEDYEILVKEEILDDCECGCSRSGCNFLSCFGKNLFAEKGRYPQFPLICERFKNAISARDLGNVMWHAPDDDYDKLRYIVFFTRTFLDLTLWVEKAANTLELSRLINEYIRLFVFSYLEIRHTCCDIDRIQHYDNPDYTRQPYPRYSPKDLRRITNEDAHLRARLEQLVPELITRHDSFEGKLQDFVVDVLIPTMRRTAKELKEEDKALYAAGRRELGVIMNEDEDETEEEEDDAEGEGFDFEEESDDEY